VYVVHLLRRSSCLACGFKRFGLASAWHRFSPCCALPLATDRSTKSAAPVPYTAQHRREVAVFLLTSRRTSTGAFDADRLAINSTFTRRPRTRVWERRRLICANELDVTFP